MKHRKWNTEIIIKDLNEIINKINHFPTQDKLIKMNRNDLLMAIARNGGLNKFKENMGYQSSFKPRNYWSNETIIKELDILIKENNQFPTWDELISMNRNDVANAMNRNGGILKFRELMGYDFIKQPDGYWTEDRIIKKLEEIINNLGHFPTSYELKFMKENSLIVMMIRNGGFNKFREILGYPISVHDKYVTKLSSYIMKRGKSSENIIKSILVDYCSIHKIEPPLLNMKLSKGNIIEFVCSVGKTVGIDVTNARTKSTISDKWRHKQYPIYLDELWIVIFSDIFTNNDYLKWNNESPENVRIFSIYKFLDELDYSIDESLKNKIDKYCKCTFHTKDELKNRK